MAVQAGDRGHPAPGRVVRDMTLCVYKMNDENGISRLVINAPDQNSRQVAEVVDEIFSQQKPEGLSNHFKRSATLVQLMIYILTATSETKLTNEMREIGKNLNALYVRFRCELQGLMARSFEMFELFKTACYYFDEERVDLGKERLERMRKISADGKKIFDDISQKMQQVGVDVEKLIARLANRRKEIGDGVFEVYSDCLTECVRGITKINNFLIWQNSFLTLMEKGFDLEVQCNKMQLALNQRSFQQLTGNAIGGFMYEIHGTIVRCIAAKKMSKAYTEQLEAIRECAVFDDMVSAFPSRRMAQQGLADEMADYNQQFPLFAFKARDLAMIQAIDWTQPAPPPESSGWWCVLM